MPHKQTDSFLFVHVVVSALPLCMYVRNMPSFSLQYVGTAGVCSTGGSVILAAQSLPDSQTFPAVLGDTELLPPCPRNIHFSDAQRDMGRDSGEAETSPERSQNEHQKTGTNRTGCVPSHPEVPELSGAMINKNILPCKIHVPFYGEKYVRIGREGWLPCAGYHVISGREDNHVQWNSSNPDANGTGKYVILVKFPCFSNSGVKLHGRNWHCY
ncbi:hypothetical protein GBAR_LOCUS15288 [Geodia barretti]|uniref:Uncharacterized protein n=1 Tax=Geodia barretti TaxID=519541 RepID=A0AA35SAW2_GEOBA|nr:hypothetical protein GBAR_LOCUS15288 [Geodia barretti]